MINQNKSIPANILHFCTCIYEIGNQMDQVKLSIKRESGVFHLKSSNTSSHFVETDGSPDIGGTDKGMRPMELLLASLGSCSAIDVILILKKQRQQLDDIKIDITAERVKIDQHSEFSKIHLFFHLFGDVKDSKARHAIQLSMDQYCSVAHILKKTAEITYDFDVNRTTYEYEETGNDQH